MAEFKLVISDPKTGKSIQREAKEGTAKALVGKKIGDSFKGELIDLPGYEFTITGGSDYAGFPMRWDVPGQARKRITAVKGIGVKNKLHKPNPKKKGWRTMDGMRLKKTVAGNTVHDRTAQVNLKVTKKGREALFPEEPAAEKKEEKKEAPSDVKKKVNTIKPAPKKAEVVEEEEEEVRDEGETVTDKAEEVAEKVEEVRIKPREDNVSIVEPGEIPEEELDDEPETKPEAKPKNKPEEKPKAAPAKKDDDKFAELDELDEEIKKDEEELEKDEEEIDELEKQIKEKD